MRLPLLLCVTTLAASAALAQQAGSTSPSSSPSKSTTQTDKSSQPGISSSQSSPSSSSVYSPTGRGAGHAGQQQTFRSTKIIGAPVKSSTGEEVGRIEDVTLNPTTGRIEFAVISAESKLVPVPWQLLSLSPSGASAQGSTSSSSSTTSGTSTSPDATSSTSPSSSGTYASASAGGQQPSLILNVEKSKLQGAPSFERSRWPEMSASWSQGIYSHFGVSPSAVGGTGAGSFRTPSSSGSSTTTPDQGSTGKASSDSSKSSSDDKK